MISFAQALAETSVFILFLGIFVSVAVRYFAIAGFAYWTCRVLFRKRWSGRRIQRKDVRREQIEREIAYSLSTIAIFGMVGSLGLKASLEGWTLLYFDAKEYGMIYFVLSFPLTIVIHDTYFYWAHRFMHWRPIYRWTHRLHHRSTVTTPFTAFAFHPFEAILEAGIFIVFLFVVPVHLYTMAFFFTAMVVWNIYVHIGFEFMPPSVARSPLGRFLGSPSHHDLHHEVFVGNYGLWFNFWDHLMGTNSPSYFERLGSDRIQTGSKGYPIPTCRNQSDRGSRP